MMMETPGGGLSTLDAEFLDGMLALGEQITALTTKYISDSDASSSPMIVDMARGTLEQTAYMTQSLKDMRGYADGDELRNAEHEANVEVVASY